MLPITPIQSDPIDTSLQGGVSGPHSSETVSTVFGKATAITYLRRLRKALELQQADLAIKRLELLRHQAGRSRLNWATLRALRNMQDSIPIESQIIEVSEGPAIQSPS